MTAAPLARRSGCGCRADPDDLPVALLDVCFNDNTCDPTVMALSVGYEARAWRAEALARHIVDWVLDFALRPEERDRLSAGRVMELTRRAVRATFGNGNDRGVPGEILLHAVCRQFFGSDTVISKVMFKTADNDTYKGFDGVHCVHGPDDSLELWLGEAKFYKGLRQAIRAALGDVDEHLRHDYLRNEFAIVADKIDDAHPHADELKRLMHPNTSLDEVFDRIVVPVLLTYDSQAAADHDRTRPAYLAAVETEARRAWLLFRDGLDTDLPVTVRLFLVPLANKAALLTALDAELAPWR